MSNKDRFSILGWAALLTAFGLYATNPEALSGRAMNFIALVFFSAVLVSKGRK